MPLLSSVSKRPRNISHRHARDSYFAVWERGSRFGFVQANMPELGVGVDDIGDDAVGDCAGCGAFLDEVGADDAEVVVGDVCECWGAFDVAESVNASEL